MFLAWNIGKVFIEQLLCQVLWFISPFHVTLTTTMLNEYSHFIGKQVEIHKDNKNCPTESDFIPRSDWPRSGLSLCEQWLKSGQNGHCTFASAEILMWTNNPQKFLSFYVWWCITNQWALQAVYPWEDYSSTYYLPLCFPYLLLTVRALGLHHSKAFNSNIRQSQESNGRN